MDAFDDTPADLEAANLEQAPQYTQTPAAQVGRLVCVAFLPVPTLTVSS